MAKIKNMGTATMRFGEGIIVTGSAGTDTHSLVVSGSTTVLGDITCNNINIGADAAGTGRTISAGNTDTSIRFNSNDGVDIVVGGSFFINCDENASQDTVVINEAGLDIDFRVETNGLKNAIFSNGADDAMLMLSNVSHTLGSDTNLFVSGVIGSRTTSTKGTSVFGGDLVVSGNNFVEGTITTTNDISFQDNAGTFPTNTAGFFWDLNNDEARIYAKQPSSDAIDFVFKLSDNNNSVDRFFFWIDDYRGGSYDRYPLLMHGGEVLFHMTETSEGVPNGSTSKVRIDSSGRIAMQATSDPSTATNYAHIYSKDVSSSAEVFVRDEAGNVTQISPHNDEGEWQYFSRNTKTGKVVKVNMEKMIRKLEEITGESFMEEYYEDPTDP